MAPVVVSLEGNIGSGKSTLLRELEKRFAGAGKAVVFVPEDVCVWEELGLLKGVYSGSLNTCAFQLAVLQSLAARLQAAAQDPECLMIVTERSIGSNANVFAKANLKGKESDLYTYAYNLTRSSLHPGLRSEYVYLKAPTDALQARIAERARDAESAIEREYIDLLNTLHDDWLAKESSVIVVDATNSMQDTADIVERQLADRLQAHIKDCVAETDAVHSRERLEIRGMHAALDHLADRVKATMAPRQSEHSGA
jgi:deoxyadenosine/deoxycytidine kinase